MTRRVLHVLASNDRRGAEVFAVDLARSLGPLGWQSTVVSLTSSTSSALVQADPLGDGHWRHALRDLRRSARVHDVVIAHGSTTLPACAVACAGVAPFVYRSIGDPAFWSSTGTKRLRTTLLLNRAHTVVTLFATASQTLVARGVTARVTTIPNAVDAGSFPAIDEVERRKARAELDIPPEVPVVLYLGALSSEKRPDRAVALGRARPDLRVLVVGDGPLRRDVEHEAAGVGNVVVLGPTSDAHQVLAATDVVIIPSDTEGIPAVAIEAGLSAIPVVASGVGGLPSVIADGQTGYLTPPGDDAALAAAVDTALGSRVEMGRAARERCLGRFDLDEVARQWADVIDAAARPRTGA